MTWILLALLAHDPITTKITWDAEISRIVNRRCFSCHAAGSSVDLSSYEQARPWAKAIRNQVLERRMPPWSPIKGFGNFRNDPSLTPLEMEMITQWAEGGAPEQLTKLGGHAPVTQKRRAARGRAHGKASGTCCLPVSADASRDGTVVIMLRVIVAVSVSKQHSSRGA